MKAKLFTAILTVLLFYSEATAQVKILNARINEFNITPLSLCEITVFNYGTAVTGIIEANLMINGSASIMKVTTRPLQLMPGLNTSLAQKVIIDAVSFSNEPAAMFIRNNHILQAGNYTYCCRIISSLAGEQSEDEYCEEISTQQDIFLFLLYPVDHDTIETLNPILIWNHGIDRGFGSGMENYRMIVTELHPGQPAQAAIQVNPPLYFNKTVLSHQVPYPFESKKLEKGKSYAWQVQRMVNGNIANSTEAWVFHIKADDPPPPDHFVIPKKSLDAGFYNLLEDELAFKFEDEYSGQQLVCRIIESSDSRSATTGMRLNSNEVTAKYAGGNLFVINMSGLNLNKGLHILEIENNKKQKSYIKFYVNK